MAKVIYDQEQREAAKRTGQALICIDIDDRQREGGLGRYTYHGRVGTRGFERALAIMRDYLAKIREAAAATSGDDTGAVCGQEGCALPAVYSYYWPGDVEPKLICEQHSNVMLGVARAIGLGHVQLTPIEELKLPLSPEGDP